MQKPLQKLLWQPNYLVVYTVITLPFSWLSLSLYYLCFYCLWPSFLSAFYIQNSLRLCSGVHGVQPTSPFRTKCLFPYLFGMMAADIPQLSPFSEITLEEGSGHAQGYAPYQKETHTWRLVNVVFNGPSLLS